MKHSGSCSRSKPPPARSSYFSSGRIRSHVNPNERFHLSMQGFNGNKMPERSEKSSGISLVVTASQKDISECISNWVTYLQMLSGLCSAGSRLSHTLSSLIQDKQQNPNNRIKMTQCQAMWEELIKASTLAISNIKSQVLSSLQEYSLANESESDIQQTSQLLFNSLITFINLQYQICAACCESLGPLAGCNCILETAQKHEPDCSFAMIQQCFQRFFPFPASPVNHKNIKNSSNFSASSLQNSQRRWSEAAAQEVVGCGDNDSTMRRWSMPWETSKLIDQAAGWPGHRLHSNSKLSVPVSSSLDRSRSVTPESNWHSSMASQEELQEVIKLLSYPLPPLQTLYQPNPKSHLPGVTLTGCTLDVSSQEPWSESTTPGSRRGSSSPHRGNWIVPESISHNWSETIGGGDSTYELYPASLASRKSSSSTDSSSSHSLHSRSTTGSLSGASGSSESGGPEIRTHLYSMWSGADLPFIKLPESNEPIEEGISEPQSVAETRHTLYTPKSH